MANHMGTHFNLQFFEDENIAQIVVLCVVAKYKSYISDYTFQNAQPVWLLQQNSKCYSAA